MSTNLAPSNHPDSRLPAAGAITFRSRRLTFAHRVNEALGGASFRRYVDHLDITGDGVDEIMLEGWRYGANSYLVVLRYADGRWQEALRTRENWCVKGGS